MMTTAIDQILQGSLPETVVAELLEGMLPDSLAGKERRGLLAKAGNFLASEAKKRIGKAVVRKAIELPADDKVMNRRQFLKRTAVHVAGNALLNKI